MSFPSNTAQKNFARSRVQSRSEQGFTLVELLIVTLVMPLVIGAISLGILAIFQVQPSIADRMASSGDTQVVSANFFRDIQNATKITTNQMDPNYQCGTSSQVLGLQWLTPGTNQLTTLVSYSLVPHGSTDNLVRNECDSIGYLSGSFVPSSSSIISYNVQSSLGATITCATAYSGCLSDVKNDWTSVAEITNVALAINENDVNHPSNNFTFTLAAAPRVWQEGSGSISGWDVVPLALVGASTFISTCSGHAGSIDVNGPILMDNTGPISGSGSKVNINTSLIYYYGNQPSTADVVGPPLETVLTVPYQDPLQGLVAPNPATLNSSPSFGNPGVYNGNIKPGAGNYTFAPGIYYFQGTGGLDLSGGATITGTNVLLYFTGKTTLTMGGNSALNLSPMTSGPYSDLTIWQDITDTSQTMNLGGTPNSKISGLVYAPGAPILLDGSGDFYADDVLAPNVSCNGTGTFNFGYTSSFPQVPATAQTLHFTSTPPAPAHKFGTYSVSASTTNAAGNPVTFSIDSTSDSDACSISNTTVTFTGTGNCIIDANQLGGGQYLAALEIQQTINVP